MLTEIIDLINLMLVKEGSKVRLQAINTRPPVFLQTLDNGNNEKEKIGFFHVCKSKKLLNDLRTKPFSDLIVLNKTLNEYVGKFIKYDNDGRQCGKCSTKLETALHNKLAIIENSDKLSLR